MKITFGLEAAAFFNGFYRMVNKRAVPMEVIRDNGVAASKELEELVSDMDEGKNQRSNITSLQKIKWHFNPPFASHFGGVFEITIKSTKRALFIIMLFNCDKNLS